MSFVSEMKLKPINIGVFGGFDRNVTGDLEKDDSETVKLPERLQLEAIYMLWA